MTEPIPNGPPGLPEQGLAPADVLDRLEALRAGDVPHEGGRLFAYVFEHGDPELSRLQHAAHAAFSAVNMLDPTAFPSVAAMENDVVGALLDVFGAPPDAVGTFTSGGTESCMLAVKSARDSRPDRARARAAGERPPGVRQGRRVARARRRRRAGRPRDARARARPTSPPRSAGAPASSSRRRSATRTASSTRSRRSPRSAASAASRCTSTPASAGWSWPAGARSARTCRRSTSRCPASRRSASTCTSTATRPSPRRRCCSPTATGGAPRGSGTAAGPGTRSSTRRSRAPSPPGRWPPRGRRSSTSGATATCACPRRSAPRPARCWPRWRPPTASGCSAARRRDLVAIAADVDGTGHPRFDIGAGGRRPARQGLAPPGPARPTARPRRRCT